MDTIRTRGFVGIYTPKKFMDFGVIKINIIKMITTVVYIYVIQASLRELVFKEFIENLSLVLRYISEPLTVPY